MSIGNNKFEAVIDCMLSEWILEWLTYWVLGQLTIQSIYSLELKNLLESQKKGEMTIRASSIYH